MPYDFPDDLPDHQMFDEPEEAYWHRLSRLKRKLIDSEKFEFHEIVSVLNEDPSQPDKSSKTFVATEKVAKWLRSELHKIRKAQRITGEAPVLLGQALGPVVISDLAISMLEDINQAPGPELIALLIELLKLDSHRRELANQQSEKKQKAAKLEAINPNLGVNELARKVDVANSTVSRWRCDPFYKKMVQSRTVSLKSFISISPPRAPEPPK